MKPTLNGTSADERLLLFAFVKSGVREYQQSGWEIINDPDIVHQAKRNFALVILDAGQEKLLNKQCSYYRGDFLKKNTENLYFVIANQELCAFSGWTLADDKESIIEI